jgi:ATP-dependent Lon protease
MAILLSSKPKPEIKNEKEIPLAPLRDGVVFPHTEAVLTFGRPKSINAVQAAFHTNKILCLVSQKNPSVSDPGVDDFYKIGTLCQIKHILKAEGEINALIVGLARVRIDKLVSTEPFLTVQITQVPELFQQSDEITALSNHLTAQFKKAVNLGKGVDFLIFMRLMSGVQPTELADQIAANLDIKTIQKQEILETFDLKKRLAKIDELLAHELKVLEIEQSIASKTQRKFDKSMKETILRERMQTIKKELGEAEDEDKETSELKKKIKLAGMPPLVLEKAQKELKKLTSMHAFNPESGYIRTYLEWLVDMPWSKESPNNVSIPNAAKILAADHYGLKEVKERILEYLAVMKLKRRDSKKSNKDNQLKTGQMATIICFVGPPGVGKTSMGKSIARALGRKFVKVSLGGIRDEAEIRGHRRTYVGALPGRIIQGVKNAGTKNPVFMLDEIDKVGIDFRGDPSAALLEALDPEQNKDFSDHYLEAPFDLSHVMFITTANVLDTIPPALRDRLEVIRFSGYTEEEKFQIAKKYLLGKVMKATGLRDGELKIKDEALRKVSQDYTREAGVRNLERELEKIARKVARKIAQGKKVKTQVNPKDLEKFLGPTRFLPTLAEKKNEVGMATGLAWTQAGGEILFVEVALMPGKGQIILTGQLGDVMKESCRAALSYLRSHAKLLKITNDFAKQDVHIHVPEGAVPKDGPSAGVAIITALYSALSSKRVKRGVGMTGEITLRGKVLEIGGVKEKVLAAHRAGLKTILLPAPNKKDLVEIPAKVKKEIKFVFVDNLNQVLEEAIA